MAMTLSSTTLTYNDGSTNTTNIQNTTAGLGAGAIGSYAFLTLPGNGAARAPGYEVAGSSLRHTSGAGTLGNPPSGSTPTTPSGSWRLMGELPAVYTPAAPTPKGVTPAFTTYALGGSVWLRYA